MIYLVVVAMTLISSVGAFFLKAGVDKANGVLGLLKSPRLYMGGCCYLAGALMNIWLLSKLDYSVLYPMTAVTYIWSIALGRLFLGEKLSKGKLIGVAVIILGVWILAQ